MSGVSNIIPFLRDHSGCLWRTRRCTLVLPQIASERLTRLPSWQCAARHILQFRRLTHKSIRAKRSNCAAQRSRILFCLQTWRSVGLFFFLIKVLIGYNTSKTPNLKPSNTITRKNVQNQLRYENFHICCIEFNKMYIRTYNQNIKNFKIKLMSWTYSSLYCIILVCNV